MVKKSVVTGVAAAAGETEVVGNLYTVSLSPQSVQSVSLVLELEFGPALAEDFEFPVAK